MIDKDTKTEKHKLHCYKNPILFRRYEYCYTRLMPYNISTRFVLKKDGNCYPQVYLKCCK